ncbi:MAG: MFS transporter, partial [Acidimicrobiales bacterium]|nr:MFS transporter [Acidimicrobiales bacterium]
MSEDHPVTTARPSDGASSTVTADTSAAGLTAVILEEEARRQAAQAAANEVTVLPDDLLVGARAEAMSLREGLRSGGVTLVLALFLVNMVDEFDRVAMPLLAPDIQKSLGVSDTVLGAIGGAAGVLFVLGAVPISYLADRARRTTIAGLATIWSAVFVGFAALARNPFTFFCARMGSGLGQSHVLPVHNSLLADGYPIGARSRIYGLHALASPVGRVLGTLAVAGAAAVATGPDGWRLVFMVVAVPGLIVGLLTLKAPEPSRGGNEQQVILGETLDGEDFEAPMVSIGYAFARLRRIRTFTSITMGAGALGFALVSVPLFVNLRLEEDFGLSATQRALLDVVISLPALISIPLFAKRNDKIFRESPPRSLLLVAGLIGAFGVFTVAGAWMPNVWGYALMFAIAGLLFRPAFALVGPVVSAVVPYRLRSQGFALVGVYVFLFGAFFGSVITGWMSDAWGRQWAITAVVMPSTILGGLLLARGATSIREDISLTIEELLEEKEENERRREADEVPALQVRNLDFSYGSVQILFDVEVEVAPGETLALLGTNGAGKSTLLRVISGLGVPSRGVVRLDGRTVTFAEAEQRVGLGLVQVPGGKATLDPLTVRENLRLGAFLVPEDEVESRIEASLELFPALRERLDEPAGALSGGQKQMLAIAKALVLEPKVLLIDELSLGLAPVVVQELLEVLAELKARGVTMVIVEQSV